MSTATSTPRYKKSKEHYRLEVSSYDRASSLLVSLLMIVGVTAVALLVIFFARRFTFQPVPPVVQPLAPGEENPNMGVSDEMEPPGLEDAPELTEPQLMDTLTALAAVSDKVAMLSDQVLDAGTQAGKGSSLGDKRQAGQGGGGGTLPERDIEFELVDQDEYARFLDHYKIELGALQPPNPEISYGSNFSAARPTTRTGAWSAERRYNFTPRGSVATNSRKLMEKAGLGRRGANIVQFYPGEAATILLGLEQQAARNKGKKIDQIRRTIFEVKPKGSGFEFQVTDQIYF